MLFRRNLLRQGRDKGLRRPDPPDPFRKTGQLLPRLAKSTGNVRFPTIRFLRQRLILYVSRFRRQSIRQCCWLFVATSDRIWLWKMRVPTNCHSERIEYAVTIVQIYHSGKNLTNPSPSISPTFVPRLLAVYYIETSSCLSYKVFSKELERA